jgi:hypothetical protein
MRISPSSPTSIELRLPAPGPALCTALRRGLLALALAGLAAGCGSRGRASQPSVSSGSTSGDGGLPAALVAQARPIGFGPQFHPGVSGPVIGRCAPTLGRRVGVHVELFARNQVVLIARGIGTRAPLRFFAGRIAGARCYGSLVTLDPTGVIYMRPGAHAVLADLFRSWGEPLSRRRLAAFVAAGRTEVAVFVNGRPRIGDPRSVPLSAHAEIVLEVGPHVPPHPRYTFPPNS